MLDLDDVQVGAIIPTESIKDLVGSELFLKFLMEVKFLGIKNGEICMRFDYLDFNSKLKKMNKSNFEAADFDLYLISKDIILKLEETDYQFFKLYSQIQSECYEKLGIEVRLHDGAFEDIEAPYLGYTEVDFWNKLIWMTYDVQDLSVLAKIGASLYLESH